jgi:predicted oxidoreductase (fatty acid repression mutant protein)
MSASSAQAPQPEQVPNTGADASRTAKDSSKTANYFELIEVSTHHYLSSWVDTDKQNRRTYYALSNKSTLSNEQITELVGKAVKFGPTSFNMQQNRAIVVTGEKHRQIWDIIIESQKGADPCTSSPPHYQLNQTDNTAVEDKVNGSFKPAYGSILFFGDNAVVDGWGAQMPAYHGVSPLIHNATVQY